MRRRIKGAWIMAGLAVIGTMMAGGGEARAAVTGITIGGGFKPGTGDPPYDYIFNVYLDPGSTFQKNDFFTIDDLVGVKPGSHHLEPGGNSHVWNSPVITLVPNVSPYASDVQWTYNGPATYSNTNPVGSGIEVFLGQFEVVTYEEFNNTSNPFPVTSGTSVDYTFGNGTTTDGGGTITLTALTPEPSSATIVLLTGGSAALAGLFVRRRRRR